MSKDKEKKAEENRRWDEKYPHKRAFLNYRSRMERQDIGFDLTYEQWLEFWGDKIDLRGNASADLCMGRLNQSQPYSINNIYISTNAQIHKERLLKRWSLKIGEV